MPLQNRVDPWGEIKAVAARGAMLGNRGGKFHRPDRTLGKRRWASRHWICCELHFKNMHHEAMGAGYTSLFFLDEVTALAAGHRPCFFCRRSEAKEFFSRMPQPMKVDAADRLAHTERLQARPTLETLDGLPDGTMIASGDEAFAISGDGLLPWTFEGYGPARPRTAVMHARLLTPALYVGILARGYQPRWHQSAKRGD